MPATYFSEFYHTGGTFIIKIFLFLFELGLVGVLFVSCFYAYFDPAASPVAVSSSSSSVSLLYFAPIVFYWFFYNIQSAIAVVLAGFERNQIQKHSVFVLFPTALLGVGEKDLPVIECFWSTPVRSLLMAAFLYLSVVFFQQSVLTNSGQTWSTTVIDFNEENKLVNEIDCTLLEVVDDVGYYFFQYTNTNNPIGTAVTDFLLYMTVYFQMLSYRSDFRLFTVVARPALYDLCNGMTITTSIGSSVLCQTSLVALAALTSLLPYGLMKGFRRCLDSPFTWLTIFLSVSTTFLSLFYFQDGMQILLALIVSAPYNKTYTSTGTTGFIYLIAMAAVSLLLCIPPANQHAKAYGEVERARKDRKEQSKRNSGVGVLGSIPGYFTDKAKSLTSMIYHLLVSQAFLLSLVAVLCAFGASEYTWPLQKASVVALNNATSAYPSYMGLNEIEQTALQATSLETLFLYELQNFTQSNANLFKSVLNLLPDIKVCVSPLFAFTVASALDSSFPCIGYDTNIDVASTLDPLVDDISGWIETEQTALVGTLFTILQDLASLAGAALSEFEGYFIQVLSILQQEAVELYSVFLELESIAEILYSIIQFIWTWAPVILTGLVVVVGVSLFLPFQRVANLIFLSSLLVILHVILGGGLLVFLLQELLNVAGYELVLVWNPYVTVLDAVTVNVCVASLLMFLNFDLYDDEAFESFQATEQLLESIQSSMCGVKKPKHNEEEEEGSEEKTKLLADRVPTNRIKKHKITL